MKTFKTLFIFLVGVLLIASCSNDDNDDVANHNEPTPPAYVSTNGLVGWWPFNGNANDESGNGNDGTAIGATITTDINNNENAAYYFDGDSQIECGTDASLNVDECTISAWVFLSTTSTSFQTIVSKYDVNGLGSYALAMFGDKADIWFSIDSSNFIDIQSSSSLSINQWHNIIATHSQSGIKLYINGVLDNSISTEFNVLQAPNDVFRIGSQGPFFPVEIQNGKIDNVGIWNRELTQNEITTLFNQ
jgi:hypothetical protein